MVFRYRKALIAMLLVLVLLASGLVFSGCVGAGVRQGGWSGVAVAGNSLFFGSASGKLVALNTVDGSPLNWSPYSFESSGSGGGFGCAAPTQVTLYGTPAVSGELVYVTIFNGKVYALNAASGALRWVYPREGAVQPIIGGLVVGQGKVYVATAGGEVYALDAATGDQVWQFKTGEVWATPAISGDTVFVASFDKKLHALDASTGNEKWQQPFETQGSIMATPLVHNGTVYVASFDRHLYALDMATGQLIWKFPSDEAENNPQKWFWASPVAFENTLYAANMDGKVYALDAGSGALVTVIDLEDAISSTPVVVNGKVIVATEAGKIYSINTSNNQSMELQTITGKIIASLTAIDSVVYIHALEAETLYALNADTGVVIWDTPIN